MRFFELSEQIFIFVQSNFAFILILQIGPTWNIGPP